MIVEILLISIILYFFYKNYYNKSVEKFKVGCDKSIQCLAPMYLPNIDKNIYKRKDKQRPWCKGWAQSKHSLKCYINKHLQRKCYWSCNNSC